MSYKFGVFFLVLTLWGCGSKATDEQEEVDIAFLEEEEFSEWSLPEDRLFEQETMVSEFGQ